MEKKVTLVGSGSLLPSQCNASVSIKGYSVPCGTNEINSLPFKKSFKVKAKIKKVTRLKILPSLD